MVRSDARISGVADHYALNDEHALEIVRNIVANLNTVKKVDIALREPRPPAYDPAELDGVVPASLMTQYDTREIIARLVDASEMDEFKANYAQTLVTGFAHIEGLPVGIVNLGHLEHLRELSLSDTRVSDAAAVVRRHLPKAKVLHPRPEDSPKC